MMIGIFGAGSIGCYLGGMLAAAGHEVVLLARPGVVADLADGMEITSLDGPPIRLRRLNLVETASALGGCKRILVCVKSMSTAEAAGELAPFIAPDTVVVSLQNGIHNAALLATALPTARVMDAMVAFNVARIGKDRFHRGTEGGIVLADQAGALELSAIFNGAGIPANVSRDIKGVKWGKLVMNLNNAVNALSGLPLKAQLSTREHRLLLADSIAEALAVMRKAGIKPARVGKVAPAMMPMLLRMPDPVFRLLAAGMLKIDEQARSSMADDLARGREPEIDYLQGEIVRLGSSLGVPTPVNEAIVARIRQLFAG
ncbi:MAG: 2-dehydropantoate 2-reductase [Nitratireductor sp.]|nr:2-dehydropantoate 2-reductase [Nitratireductor sp.]